MKTKNRYRQKYQSKNGYQSPEEIDKFDVVTKPNAADSVRDILFRNTSGMSYDNYKTPYYEEQATLSSQALNVIQDMEPAEKMQFLAEKRKEFKSLQDKIAAYEAEKARIAAEAEEAAKKDAIIKDYLAKNSPTE